MNDPHYWMYLFSQLSEKVLLECPFHDRSQLVHSYHITCVCLLVAHRHCCSFSFQLAHMKPSVAFGLSSFFWPPPDLEICQNTLKVSHLS